MQGLRGCRNAGIAVPKEVIDKAIHYIRACTTPAGGVQYNSHGGGERPPITAAAIACLFNAGDYDDKYVPKLLAYCREQLGSGQENGAIAGHWHYTHYYYSQVIYREGGKTWDDYRDEDLRPHPLRGQPGRLLGARVHGPDLHHGDEPDDFAIAARSAADLSAVRG